jgi:iron(III) transport system ATP-binding protein
VTDLRATEAEPGPAAGTRPAAGSSHPQGVSISGLVKAFGAQPVLRGVDIEIPRGSVTAVLGSSGSGKTTLLRMLAGFERPDAGTITIGGALVNGPGRHVAPQDRHVGYVPQEGCLFPHLDVAGNVGFGLPRAQRRGRVPEMLELTGLSDLAGRYPHQLSGGQQQRVALARALAPDPALLLLDEPFSSLDAFLRTSVRLEVLRVLRKAGTTTVIVTHDQDEALSSADQVAVLRQGLVAHAAAPQELYARPADAGLAQFVGDANLLPGTVRGGRAGTALGELALTDGSPAFADGEALLVLLRPEQLRLLPADAPDSVPGTVTQRDFHGHDTVVTVDTPACGPLTVRCAGAAELPPGTPVALRATGPVTGWAAADAATAAVG